MLSTEGRRTNSGGGGGGGGDDDYDDDVREAYPVWLILLDLCGGKKEIFVGWNEWKKDEWRKWR